MFAYNPYFVMMGNPYYGGYAQNPAYVAAPQPRQPAGPVPGAPGDAQVCVMLSPRVAQSLLNAQPYYVEFCGYPVSGDDGGPWQPDYSKPAVRAVNGAKIRGPAASCPFGMTVAWNFGGVKLCVPIGVGL